MTDACPFTTILAPLTLHPELIRIKDRSEKALPIMPEPRAEMPLLARKTERTESTEPIHWVSNVDRLAPSLAKDRILTEDPIAHDCTKDSAQNEPIRVTPFTDKDDPSLAKHLRETEELMAVELKDDKYPRNRKKDLTERDEPACICESIETQPDTLRKFAADTAEPHRAKERIDKLEPQWVFCKTDALEHTRTLLRRERLEPI
jgi:hypothetical protein